MEAFDIETVPMIKWIVWKRTVFDKKFIYTKLFELELFD